MTSATPAPAACATQVQVTIGPCTEAVAVLTIEMCVDTSAAQAV